MSVRSRLRIHQKWVRYLLPGCLGHHAGWKTDKIAAKLQVIQITATLPAASEEGIGNGEIGGEWHRAPRGREWRRPRRETGPPDLPANGYAGRCSISPARRAC